MILIFGSPYAPSRLAQTAGVFRYCPLSFQTRRACDCVLVGSSPTGRNDFCLPSPVARRHCRITNIEIKMPRGKHDARKGSAGRKVMGTMGTMMNKDGRDGQERAAGRAGKCHPSTNFFNHFFFSYHTHQHRLRRTHRPIRLSMPALLRGFSTPSCWRGGAL